MRAAFLAFVISALCAGCSDGGSASRPSPIPTAVTVTAPTAGALFLGETYTFTMTARMSDGTMITTGGTWGSDAPAVATVNSSSGAVQVVGLGEATIYVDFQGQRGTQRIRATIRYDGDLRASSRVTNCVDTGDWAEVDACAEFPNGFESEFSGTFTQSDRTVTAVMSLGAEDLGTPATAQVGDNGELRFQSVHTDGDMTITVHWMLQPSGLTQIGGSLVLRIEFVGVSGHIEISGTIIPSGITRVAGSAARSGRSYEEAIARAARRLLR